MIHSQIVLPNRTKAIEFVHSNISNVLLTTQEFNIADSEKLVDALIAANLMKIV